MKKQPAAMDTCDEIIDTDQMKKELQDDGASSSSDDSVSEVNAEQFQQHNFLFLFDEELGISKEGSAALTPEHYF